MADVKISALPAVPVAVATTDLFAIVQGGVTYKATLTQVIAAIPDATGSTRGILSAADWTTFNSKQSALTFSTGLTNAAGTVTGNLSTGVAGGQSVIGGTAASNSLTLSSTSNATKGKILFGTSAYDEVNNRLGLNQTTPLSLLHLKSGTSATSAIIIEDPNAAPTGLGQTTVYITGNGQSTAGANNSEFGIFVAGPGSTSTSQGPVIGMTGNNFTRYANGRGQLFFYSGQTPTPIGLDGTIQFGCYSSFIDFQTGSSYTSRLRIFNGGNVFIGASPTDAGFRLDVNGTARIQGDLTISTKNIITDTTTGTKIGTATGQKLGFWNAAPIAQPTTAVAAATLVGGGGTNITDTDTFDGYTLQQVVKALRNAGLLA